MAKKILSSANRIIRKNRPRINADKVCDVFVSNELLEIGFLSKQCTNDAKGSCIMCDYGCANETRDIEVYIEEMRKIIKKHNDFDLLLLCTNGSFMDSKQISDDLFFSILNEANKYSFSTLEIETHYQNVTREKLDTIRQIVKEKKVCIEMGLETVNENIQNKYIMKNISMQKLKNKIDLIHSYGYETDINIMLGMPFLSVKEQLEDALVTSDWVFENNSNLIVFPMNIKPFTLLFHMYETGFYQPISHWLMIEFLNKIPIKHLGKITVAWYGNREEKYEGSEKRVVFPSSCPNCHENIFHFYYEFNKSSSSDSRKTLIKELIQNRKCKCYDELFKTLNSVEKGNNDDAYLQYINIVKKEFNIKE